MDTMQFWEKKHRLGPPSVAKRRCRVTRGCMWLLTSPPPHLTTSNHPAIHAPSGPLDVCSYSLTLLLTPTLIAVQLPFGEHGARRGVDHEDRAREIGGVQVHNRGHRPRPAACHLLRVTSPPRLLSREGRWCWKSGGGNQAAEHRDAMAVRRILEWVNFPFKSCK